MTAGLVLGDLFEWGVHRNQSPTVSCADSFGNWHAAQHRWLFCISKPSTVRRRGGPRTRSPSLFPSRCCRRWWSLARA